MTNAKTFTEHETRILIPMIKGNMLGGNPRQCRGYLRDQFKLDLAHSEVDAILNSLVSRGYLAFDLSHGEPSYWIPDIPTYQQLTKTLAEALERDRVDEDDKKTREAALKWWAFHREHLYKFVVLPILVLVISAYLWRSCDLPQPPKKFDVSSPVPQSTQDNDTHGK